MLEIFRPAGPENIEGLVEAERPVGPVGNIPVYPEGPMIAEGSVGAYIDSE